MWNFEKKETRSRQIIRGKPPHPYRKDIKTIRGVAPRRKEKIARLSILTDFKSALSQYKKAYEESDDTSNVPFASVEGISDLSGNSITRPPPRGASKQWVFTTKPQFKRLEKSFKEPMIDVFDEAMEVQIIIDLGNFRRGEIDIDIKPDKYIIFAKKGATEFREEIVLPPNVDVENTEEYFRNGILQIILPKKRGQKT